MSKEQEYIDDLIVTCLADHSNKRAWDELKQWMAASPENEQYFRHRQEIWFSALDGNESRLFDDANEAYALFLQRVKQAEASKMHHRTFRLNPKACLRYAAAIIALIAASYYSYWRGEERAKEHCSDVMVEAPLGSRTRLNLPDGTQVWLNAGSRIIYAPGFGTDNRRVTLSGEGYFEVRKNEKIPFYVESRTLKVRVVGTKFNFRDYPSDEEAVVSLSEGKVALDNLLQPNDETLLSPNERVVVNKRNGKMRTEQILASNATLWTSGHLSFDEELLPDVVKRLERSYNVDIYIATDSLKTLRLYGHFARGEQNIEEVLDVLEATHKIHCRRDGRNITLY